MKIKQQNVKSYQNMITLLSYLSAQDGEEVYNKLQRLERKASRITTAQCNGDANEKADKDLERIEKQIKQLLPNLKSFFINGDPRGYALKFKESEVQELRISGYYPHTDFGGYGILAPEL